MKKQLLLLAMMLLPMVAIADAVEVDGIYYNLDTEAKTAEVTKNPKCYSGSVDIPEMVLHEETEYSVTSIGNNAFQYCSGLTSITIPNSVTSIGVFAFEYCSGLTSITIPNSVTSIGGSAFYCTGLTSVTIGNSVTSIGKYAFSHCNGLTSITIPNSVTSIGERAFEYCSGLASVTIGNSVTSIENYAFSHCSGLTSITIPNSVTSIGDHAFEDCSGLTSVTIGNSVTSIGNLAFAYCSGLTSIGVESGNTKYDSRDNCNALIETASNTLIAGCKNTTIPNSVTSIGLSAFVYCSGLTSITIPNSVTSIGNNAFLYCSGLASITIPNSVTSIGNNAFQYCSGLTSITIPNSVTSIGERAFYLCSGLLDMFCYAENVPTTGSNAFDYSNIANATLHVPSESVGAYQAADQWKNFKEIVAMLKCATPTIKYIGGKLKFECETEDVEFISQFSMPAGTDNNTSEVSIPTTYNVSVYAKKEGYQNSDVATENIDVRGLKGDVNQDGEVTVTDAVEVVNIIMEKEN